MFVDPCGLEKVGLREYSESHGAVVEWNSDEKCAYVYYNGKELKIKSTKENNKNGRIYVDEEILYTFFEDRIKITGSTSPQSLPITGEPNSSQKIYNPDGSLKQERWYGPDGRALRDRDYNHPGDKHIFPHDHDWKNGKRQGGKPTNTGEDNDSNNADYMNMIGTGLAIGGGAYVIYRVIRMIPSLIPAFWGTIPLNAACP